MAKKKAGGRRPKQQKIPGTYDEVPAEVQKAVDDYVDCLRERQRCENAEAEARERCMELMRAHRLKRVEIDDEKDLLLLSKGEKLAIKKRGDKAAA